MDAIKEDGVCVAILYEIESTLGGMLGGGNHFWVKGYHGAFDSYVSGGQHWPGGAVPPAVS